MTAIKTHSGCDTEGKEFLIESCLSIVGGAEGREVRSLWGSAGMHSTQELTRGLKCVKEKSNTEVNVLGKNATTSIKIHPLIPGTVEN